MTAVITYDAVGGSDTAPTGNDGSGTNGDWSGTTLTLNETVDFTGVADDGTDYVWVDTPAGSRKLARVTAFNPSVGACTSLTTAESSTGSYTADNWAVNGERQTFTNDSSQHDDDDWMPGWTIKLKSGTYVRSGANFEPGGDATHSVTSDKLTIMAHEDATTMPVIDTQSNHRLLQIESASFTQVIGIRFITSTGGGSNCYVDLWSGNASAAELIGCKIEAHTSASQAVYINGQTASSLVGCHITGGSTYGVYIFNANRFTRLANCRIDGEGTAGDTALVYVDDNICDVVLDRCLIVNSDGDGVVLANPNDSRTMHSITGCTIADCDGDGIVSSGTAGTIRMMVQVQNCIIDSNGAYGMTDDITSSSAAWMLYNNALRNNTSGNLNNVPADQSAITLTGDPFVDHTDYELNTTDGAGNALRGQAYLAIPGGV